MVQDTLPIKSNPARSNFNTWPSFFFDLDLINFTIIREFVKVPTTPHIIVKAFMKQQTKKQNQKLLIRNSEATLQKTQYPSKFLSGIEHSEWVSDKFKKKQLNMGKVVLFIVFKN